MTAPTPRAPGPVAFKFWLRQELGRELKLGAVFLALGLAAVFVAGRLWSGFDARWTRLNYQLTYVALDQHPTALLDTFATRLSETEYGWGFFSLAEPFNVSAARARLHADFPDFVGVGADGRPVPLRSSARRRADPAVHEARAAEFLARHHQLEARRFARLYRPAGAFDAPSPTDRLARYFTKLIGLPDAFLHLARTIVASGITSILLFSGTLAITAVALWNSARPSRLWFKLLLLPFLASTLGWWTIGLMSVSAALFGSLTANTAALAVLAGAPLLYLAAKAPLRLLEELRLQPRPWDGVERRRAPRPPTPPPPPAAPVATPGEGI